MPTILDLNPGGHASRFIEMFAGTAFSSYCLSFIALVPITPVRPENALATNSAKQGTAKAYCASNPGQPVIYFSGIFDTNTTTHLIDTQPLANAFKDFLKEMYDYKANTNHPTGCPAFDTVSQAEASKRQLVIEEQRAKKQTVEVNWKPGSGVEVRKMHLPGWIVCGPTTVRTDEQSASRSSIRGSYTADVGR